MDGGGGSMFDEYNELESGWMHVTCAERTYRKKRTTKPKVVRVRVSDDPPSSTTASTMETNCTLPNNNYLYQALIEESIISKMNKNSSAERMFQNLASIIQSIDFEVNQENAKDLSKYQGVGPMSIYRLQALLVDLEKKPEVAAASAVASAVAVASVASFTSVAKVPSNEASSEDGETSIVATRQEKSIISQGKTPETKPPDTPHEQRLNRFRKRQTIAIQQRIQRALNQRLYLIHTSPVTICPRNGGPTVTFNVLGSTGNIYDVTIAKIPHCSCPDHKKGNLCKHILFIMLKVVGLDPSSSYVYQDALLSIELQDIFDTMSRRKAALGMVEANEAVKEQYAKMTGGDSNDNDENVINDVTHDVTNDDGDNNKNENENDECPICFDRLGANLSELTFCQSTCGQKFHSECINMWKTQSTTPTTTCPACRQEWVDTETEKAAEEAEKCARRVVMMNYEGYQNLGSLQGQSQERSYYNTRYGGGYWDYSTRSGGGYYSD